MAFWARSNYGITAAEVSAVRDYMESTGGANGASAPLLKSFIRKLTSPSPSFSAAHEETLEKLQITSSGDLHLRPDYAVLAETSKAVGQSEHWCSEFLYHHLDFLQQLVPIRNEQAARLWSDAYFFRAAAMASRNDRMVLNIEQTFPGTYIDSGWSVTISGVVDYVAVLTDEKEAAAYRAQPTVGAAQKFCTSFFITEEKQGSLSPHVPQAICEMFVIANELGKSIIRGALTNGLEWVFLILYLEEGSGGTYKLSEPIGGDQTAPWPDVVSGILSHWIKRSFDDIAEDDWFTTSTL